MSLRAFKNQIRLSLVIIALFFGLFTHAADPAAGRAKYVEVTPSQYQSNLENLSLRWKIISSRALILYMQDILPSKGNPYYHMAEFSAVSTLEGFKSAQAYNSSYMNDESHPYWLPVDAGKNITSEDMKDSGKSAVVNYFAQFVGTSEVMKTLVQPVLAKSIVIGTLEETAGKKVKDKFDQAWVHMDYVAKKYSQLLNSNEVTKDAISVAKKKATLSIAVTVAKGMLNYSYHVETSANKESIRRFFEMMNDLSDEDVSKVAEVKNKVSSILDSDANKQVAKAFVGVDLPDSGDIDGSDEAFEVAMRLEVGYEVIMNLLNDVKKNW